MQKIPVGYIKKYMHDVSIHFCELSDSVLFCLGLKVSLGPGC